MCRLQYLFICPQHQACVGVEVGPGTNLGRSASSESKCSQLIIWRRGNIASKRPRHDNSSFLRFSLQLCKTVQHTRTHLRACTTFDQANVRSDRGTTQRAKMDLTKMMPWRVPCDRREPHGAKKAKKAKKKKVAISTQHNKFICSIVL